MAVKDAYSALKAVLIASYKFVSVPLLEQNPGDATYQAAARNEIASKPGIIDDPGVLGKLEELLDALKNAPTSDLRSAGINIDFVDAGKNIVAQRTGAIRGKRWTAKEDVRFVDVGREPQSGK